jgi:peptidoglycan hydrolase-like protein with peptidoglycan-binding domain/3D (Asp-Asp-Asp) domain-containing protein
MVELAILASFLINPTQNTTVTLAEDITYPYTKTFTISAYYSPLTDQSYYVTGTYDGDIRLNGNGTNGADGTEVYPGMIAAPQSYDFGTKMYIPGVGMVAVHDRGGAIVDANEEGKHDRLDIWMGYGDEGLERALNWGMRTIEVTVYGPDDTIVEEVYLEGYSDAEKFIKEVVSPPELFPSDLWYGTQNDDTLKLQEYLTVLGYYKGTLDGYYGDDTTEAVFMFQVDQGILDDWSDFGAGHFGINSRRAMDNAVDGVDMDSELQKVETINTGFQKMQSYSDLKEDPDYFTGALARGDSGDDVYALQAELANLGYFMIEPTGYYGEVTEHAVFKLQQKLGIVDTMEDQGAGIVGPTTMSTLNEVVRDRIDTKSYIALRRDDDVYLAKE